MSRQVQTEIRKTHPENRRERRTEPATSELTQTTHERNQAELQWAVPVIVTGKTRPRSQELRRRAVRVVSPSSVGSAAEDAEPSWRSEPRRDTPSLLACKAPTRGSLTPRCGILRSQLHAQPEPYTEAARCEVGICPEKQPES